MESRLKKFYKEKVVGELKAELKLENVHLVPRINKVVINTGVKEAVQDQKVMNEVVESISNIAGQRAVKTKAKKSIAGFKLREGLAIGVMVTLRKARMYDFLDKLINVALPGVRDFRGIKASFDGNGNLNIGIKDSMIFPEIDFDKGVNTRGLNISIVTGCGNDAHAKALIKKLGVPFIS